MTKPKNKVEKIFKIDPAAAPKGFRNRVSCSVFERAVGLRKLDTIIHNGRIKQREDESRFFCDDVLLGMGVNLKLSDEDRARIPKTGPVIVVANHPFGGVEGVVMMSIIHSVRPDMKAMGNYILQAIPEMREMFFPVNPFGSAAAAKQNVKPLIDTVRWLKDGHILGVFPSGEVSSIDLKSGRVRDPKWSDTIAAIAQKTNAAIVPLYFAGRNPAFFQLAGLIHPRLRTALLPTMTHRKTNCTIEARIGTPITPAEAAKFASPEELIQYARLRTYALEARAPKPQRLLSFRRKRRQSARKLAEIVAETPVEKIEAAINAFPESAFLLEGGDLRVYISKLPADSPVMREIGRLREISFRAVGEGTGRETDLDSYDAYYHHLFIWHVKDRRIVGSYRLGMTDEICARYGVEGLYTHTLFKFGPSLIAKFQPAIELGRSFVRPEYQRSFSPLLFLWRGIGAFVARNPEHANLFGPVSITADYKPSSRNMILRSLRLSNFAEEFSRLIKPRRPPRDSHRKEEWRNPDFEDFISDVEGVSAIIQDIENDRKGIPILIKQYLKLGGKIISFNVDKDFQDVIDGLILIDLRKTEPRTRIRYMGDEYDKSFREFHKL